MLLVSVAVSVNGHITFQCGITFRANYTNFALDYLNFRNRFFCASNSLSICMWISFKGHVYQDNNFSFLENLGILQFYFRDLYYIIYFMNGDIHMHSLTQSKVNKFMSLVSLENS